MNLGIPEEETQRGEHKTIPLLLGVGIRYNGARLKETGERFGMSDVCG
jgi:hypothetical protein